MATSRLSLSRRSRFVHLQCDRLEDRLAPATFIVNDPSNLGDANLADGKPLTINGTVTLRAVFDHMNVVGGSHVINFSDPMTINLGGSTLSYGAEGGPSGALTINGLGVAAPAVKIIGGLLLGNGCYVHDLQITGSSYRGLIVHNNCKVINNVISGNADYGLFVHGSGTTVQGNYIGVTADGKTALPNAYGIGILGSSNVIGGATSTLRNVVSGNKNDGINVWFNNPVNSSGNVIKGNYIGVSADGSAAIRNGKYGIAFTGNYNQIGGLAAGEGNLIISGAGFAAVGLDSGFWPFSSTGNRILGNLIGAKADGNSMFTPGANPPAQSIGIFLQASNSLTNTAVKNNVVADCLTGVYVQQSSNVAMTGTVIQGNKIGVGIDGSTVLRNQDGIYLSHSEGVTIGSTAAAGKNIISGNTQNGIRLANSANKNKVYGNYIGTNVQRNNLGNGLHGVLIENGSDNFLGTQSKTAPISTAYANSIAFNGFSANKAAGERGHAVEVVQGERNTIRGNTFFDNAALSINLVDPAHPLQIPQNDVGVTDNKGNVTTFPDADSGPNTLQNSPVVKALDVVKKTMTWQLNAAPNKTYTIDFYRDDFGTALGFGEGTTFVQKLLLTTGATGHGEVTIPWVNGRFMTATATDSLLGNTSPFSMVDSDADGLADGWEANGIDINMDGVIDQALPGADPFKKDIFVEADVMAGAIDPGVNIADVFNLVTQAFANAPAGVNNPDGKGGVQLHINSDLAASTVAADPLLNPVWTEFEAAKAINLGAGTATQKAARALAFRYCIFAQQFQAPGTGKIGHSGISELGDVYDPTTKTKVANGGNDFIVALRPDFFSDAGTGKTVTVNDLAGTFMHELGHTLGLQHGGVDGVNNKPNYYSVMNYLWQFQNDLFRFGQTDTDYSASWTLDYSRQPLPKFDERAVYETSTEIHGVAGKLVPVFTRVWIGLHGWGLPAHALPWHVVPQTGKDPATGGTYIDWARDKRLDAMRLMVDVNDDGEATVLEGAEDWSRLSYNFRESPTFGSSHGSEAPQEISSNDFGPGLLRQPAVEVVIAGADVGNDPRVQVFAPDGKIAFDFLAFDPGFKGGVRVAKGDVNGDGVADIIAAMGPGGDTVKVFDGKTGAKLFAVTPYGAGFTGGINVAAGNATGDGKAEIFVAPASGIGSTVKMLSGTDGSEIRSILAYTATTKTGVTVAAGDVNGDGSADVIVGAATGANPQIKIFNGVDGKLIRYFNAYSPAFNGVFLAAGDVNGDGKADIIVGAGAGTAANNAPLVRVYSGANPAIVLRSFLADALEFHGGTRVAVVKLTDGSFDIVTGTGPTNRTLRRFKTNTLDLNWEVTPFDSNFSGIFVG
jgi:parallel beta-helix repeat protein